MMFAATAVNGIAARKQKNRLTNDGQSGIMMFHTVAVCRFEDFSSDMVILSQEGAAVKRVIR